VIDLRLPWIDGDPLTLPFAALCLVGFLVLWRLGVAGRRWEVGVGAALVLMLATNALHGIDYGFRNPIVGGSAQYYHDLSAVASPTGFLADFNELQPSLGVHARTHPPGAVLLFRGLTGLFPDVALVSVTISVISVLVSGTFLVRIAARFLPREALGEYVLLYVSLPAVQVYTCSSIDAIIASLVIAAAYFALHERTAVAVAGGASATVLVSTLTFGVGFLGPVLVGLAVLRRSIWRVTAWILTVVAFWTIVFVLTGFDYPASFVTACRIENPGGVYLLVDPVLYLATRLEGVLEILVFLGPAALLLLRRGFAVLATRPEGREIRALTILALTSLALMLVAGAYRTGETARTCLFIYPFLFFPVAAGCVDARSRSRALVVTFGFGLAMQTFARFFW